MPSRHERIGLQTATVIKTLPAGKGVETLAYFERWSAGGT
jgi:hypothetical protein